MTELTERLGRGAGSGADSRAATLRRDGHAAPITIPASGFSLSHPEWSESMVKLVRKVSGQLSLPTALVRWELSALMVVPSTSAALPLPPVCSSPEAASAPPVYAPVRGLLRPLACPASQQLPRAHDRPLRLSFLLCILLVPSFISWHGDSVAKAVELGYRVTAASPSMSAATPPFSTAPMTMAEWSCVLLALGCDCVWSMICSGSALARCSLLCEGEEAAAPRAWPCRR